MPYGLQVRCRYRTGLASALAEAAQHKLGQASCAEPPERSVIQGSGQEGVPTAGFTWSSQVIKAAQSMARLTAPAASVIGHNDRS
jgi:hypothetical protein